MGATQSLLYFGPELVLTAAIMAVLALDLGLTASGVERSRWPGVVALAGAAAGNLLMAYLSLEFASLTSYVLTGFLRHNRRSGEAALKYLIYGGVASGAMIYGMSWVFGLTGSMDYAAIAAGVARLDDANRGAFFLALVLVLAGFGYKVASVPFHMWAPDVYTGAPI